MFDTYEYVHLCDTAVAGVDVVNTFTVPWGSLTGFTGMRIRSRATAGALDSTSDCLTFGSGEAEDYVINIGAPLSVTDPNYSLNLSVLPNPTSGIITVGVNNTATSNINIQVMNIEGEKVYNEQIQSVSGNVRKSIDLSSFAKGIYLVRIITNQETIIRKISLQ